MIGEPRSSVNEVGSWRAGRTGRFDAARHRTCDVLERSQARQPLHRTGGCEQIAASPTA